MMKPLLLFSSIVLLSLLGCSSTYQITDYPSNAKYHDSINESIKNSSFSAVTNDSSFTCSEGSEIKNDSLFAIIKEQSVKLHSKDIKETKFFGNDIQKLSAYIKLKNGATLTTEDFKILSDSTIQFTNIFHNHIPLLQLNQISYKNHWKGIVPGLTSGFLVGFTAGITGLIFHVVEGQILPERDYTTGGLLGGISGMLLGGIVGYIIGWDDIYLFKP